jgi:hypothetical protein
MGLQHGGFVVGELDSVHGGASMVENGTNDYLFLVYPQDFF